MRKIKDGLHFSHQVLRIITLGVYPLQGEFRDNLSEYSLKFEGMNNNKFNTFNLSYLLKNAIDLIPLNKSKKQDRIIYMIKSHQVLSISKLNINKDTFNQIVKFRIQNNKKIFIKFNISFQVKDILYHDEKLNKNTIKNNDDNNSLIYYENQYKPNTTNNCNSNKFIFHKNSPYSKFKDYIIIKNCFNKFHKSLSSQNIKSLYNHMNKSDKSIIRKNNSNKTIERKFSNSKKNISINNDEDLFSTNYFVKKLSSAKKKISTAFKVIRNKNNSNLDSELKISKFRNIKNIPKIQDKSNTINLFNITNYNDKKDILFFKENSLLGMDTDCEDKIYPIAMNPNHKIKELKPKNNKINTNEVNLQRLLTYENKNEFDILKDEFNSLYTKNYINNITDDLLKLEIQLLVEKIVELINEYHNKIAEENYLYKDMNKLVSDYKNNYYILVKLYKKLNVLNSKCEDKIHRIKNVKKNYSCSKIKDISISNNEFLIFQTLFNHRIKKTDNNNKFNSKILTQMLKNVVLKILNKNNNMDKVNNEKFKEWINLNKN